MTSKAFRNARVVARRKVWEEFMDRDELSQESYVSANGSTCLAPRTLRFYMSERIKTSDMTSEKAGKDPKVAREVTKETRE